MDSKAFLDWWPVWTLSISVIITGSVGWARLTDKIDRAEERAKADNNGIGQRLASVEGSTSAQDGRMDRVERELSEYRRDAQAASAAAARVEKSVDDLRSEIQQGNLQIGSQLAEITKLITEQDKQTSVRLVRIETVQRLEEKLGPLLSDS